jgi:putative acetyltransferase
MTTDDKPPITIRAMQDEDLPATTAIRQMPHHRWGTLATPFESVERWRKYRASNPAPTALLVACAGDAVVGTGGIFGNPLPRRAHAASLGIGLHDDWRGKGVGTALFGALIDMADNWLGLRRLELAVYCDNPPAIALYEKFGFQIEAREVADAYRDGVFVDSYFMGRLRGDLPRDTTAYPPHPTPAPAGPFKLRAAEPEDVKDVTDLMNQPRVRHGTLRLPFSTPADNAQFVASTDPTARSIVAVADGTVVGIIKLNPAKGRRAHCADIQVVAVHDAWHGRGIGTALLAAVVETADNWLNIKRLSLGVSADNLPAIGLYETFGFRAEGIARANVFRNGGFSDTMKMARLR